MKFLPSPLNVNYTVLQRWVRTKVFCQIGEETKQIFWSISTQQGFATVVKPLVNTSPDRCGVHFVRSFVRGCSWSSPFLKLASHLQPLARRWQVVHPRARDLSWPLQPPPPLLWPQSTQLLFQPSAVPLPRETNRVLFCLSRRRGWGREQGVLWRRNVIHIMSGAPWCLCASLAFQRSRNACKPWAKCGLQVPGN